MRREDVSIDEDFPALLQDAIEHALGDPLFRAVNVKNSEEIFTGLKAALHSAVTNHNRIVVHRARAAQHAAAEEGRSVEEQDRAYMANRVGFVERTEPATSKLIALLTAESGKELATAVVSAVIPRWSADVGS